MNETNTTTLPKGGRGWLWLGLGLAVFNVLAYVAQVMAHQLRTPWYLPITGTIAVLLVIRSLLHRRGVWRYLALGFVVLLAGMEWMFVIGGRLPSYAGPVAVGKPFPRFATLRADGSPFTERDLGGAQNDVIVFFRGRW
jgi:hypothetical protein